MAAAAGKRFILILGGARSGKSDLAQKLARSIGDDQVLFVATAAADDEEMRARIAAHQAARPASWRTLEVPLQVADALAEHRGAARLVLVDCVTLWVSNMLGATSPDGGETPDLEAAKALLQDELGALHDWYRGSDASLILVSNEVGMGLVPPYPSGRAYRDLLGVANQFLATRATEVYLTVAGIPIELKSLAIHPWHQGPGDT